MQKFQLDIVTPYGEIFKGSVQSVYLPGKDGEFGVLPGHCDMLALLQTGVIEIFHDEQKSKHNSELVAINWGYVEISNNKVCVLADGAVSIRGGDTQISQALGQAKKLLQEASTDTSLLANALRKLDDL